MIGSIIGAIVIGAVVGVLARMFLPGRQDIGLGLTILVGIVAAFVGTLIAGLFGFADTGGIDWWEHLIQLLLAMVGVASVASTRSRPGGS